MTDPSARLEEAMAAFQEVVDSLTPEEAYEQLEEAILQLFWKDWPDLSSWAGGLWRRLNEDLAEPASEVKDPELDEVGEGGGG